MYGVTQQQKLPPDGGYGWVITFACSLKKIIIIPIAFDFGLVLQQSYDDTNISPTQCNRVILWRSTIETLLSLFGGPVLHRFGYRKVAVVGSIAVFIGLALTSTASSFWHLLFYYTIILSIAEAVSVPAFDLALNSFFKEKREKAIGIVTFCAGLGPLFMPNLMSIMLSSYGWRYTVLVLSALSLHCLLAALLLRPAKWYMKVESKYEETNFLPNNTSIHVTTLGSGNPTTIQNAVYEETDDVESLRRLSGELHKANGRVPKNGLNKSQEQSLLPLITSTNSKDETNRVKGMNSEPNNNNDNTKIINKIIGFFDLTLLKDPVFANIVFGMCISQSVEVSFSLMLPIILEDMIHLETNDIATLKSIMAFSDLLFRLFGPYITAPWHKSPRVIAMVSLLASIAARSAMIYTNSFNGLICIALAMGIAKGIRTTYLKVVLPDYIPLNRLTYAFGIVQFFKGITIALIGEISSRLRDTTASYKIPIIVLNIFTMITIVMWTAEIVYFKFKKPLPKAVVINDG